MEPSSTSVKREGRGRGAGALDIFQDKNTV